jgi:hypothetical protein
MILYSGEIAIGKLKAVKINEDWVVGRFCSFAEFQNYKQLFSALETAWICEAEEYFDYQEKVDALDLFVKTIAGLQKISDFKIIYGQFEYKIKH